MKTSKKMTAWVFVISAVIASLALLAGIQHNPQSEFFDPTTNSFDFGYAVMVFASWLLLSMVVVGGCAIVIFRFLRHKDNKNDCAT